MQLGFDESVSDAVVQQLEAEKYLIETWQQLSKDFRLSGLTLQGLPSPDSLEEMHQNILEAMPDDSHASMQANLLYRIDLPEKVSARISSKSELALAIIVRAFHKVWLRGQFSSAKAANHPL